MITTTECLIIANEAIKLAEAHISSSVPNADARLRARQALDEAKRQRDAGAARPSLMWACKSVQHSRGIASDAYAEVQAKYNVVYESHLEH